MGDQTEEVEEQSDGSAETNKADSPDLDQLTRSRWPDVLQTLQEYNLSGGNAAGPTRRKLAQVVAQKHDVPEIEVHQALIDLEEYGLVRFENLDDQESRDEQVVLKPDGFQVAHERHVADRQSELQQEQVNSNNKLYIVTAFLVLGTVVETAVLAFDLTTLSRVLTGVVLIGMVLTIGSFLPGFRN